MTLSHNPQNPSPRRLTRLLKWLIRWRRECLLLAIVLGGSGAYVGRELKMDRSLQSMFASTDPLIGVYQDLQTAFGQHDIVLAIYGEQELSSSDGLARVATLSESARQIPGIAAVVSLGDVPGMLESDGSAFKTDERSLKLQQVFAGYTHDQNLTTSGIVCLLEKNSPAGVTTTSTVAELQALISRLPEGKLIGEPVLLGTAFDMLELDGRRLNTWCLGLLLATIYICFRQIRWMILPLVLVQVALATTRGLLVALDVQLSMVSSMLAAIVTVVGVATVMHVIVRYRDERGMGRSPRQALLRTGQALAAPVMFACLTDAVGFGSLMISDVKPVVDFGLMMSLGSLLVLVAIGLTVPGIALWGGDKRGFVANLEETRLELGLHWLYEWSIRNRWRLGGVLALSAVVAAWGSTKLIQETDFTKNFRPDSALVQNYQFVDLSFGGAGVWDILIPAPRQLDKKFLTQILAFQALLRERAPGLTKVLSLADILDAGAGGLDKLEFGADLAIRAGLGLMRARMPEFVAATYNPRANVENRYFRVMLRAPERLEASDKSALIAEVRSATADVYPEAKVTGFYVLLTQLIESLLKDQWTSFGAAGLGISILMLWAFRNLRLALLALIPNVLPVLWLFGAMGLLGVRVNMGVAMIAAVSMGLSVDASIHYVMSYQRLRRLGTPRDAALQAVQASVGQAAVMGTLALVVGFATLSTSQFMPTVYFGVLVSLSMIGGLVGNLVVLPLLIRVVER